MQEFLLGWTTTVIEGNKVSLDSNSSPVLNYFNTESDRKTVIGEKSLCISDKINFKRRVSQTITSTPYVKLEDGNYTLTAKLKNSSGFAKLEMYIVSDGKIRFFTVKEENASWKTIAIERVAVKGGKAEIGFLAEGTANSFCYVDDVTLMKTK